MGADSKIEWCDHTFNPWIGCTKVSPGCANCYAEGESKRRGWAQWGKGQDRHRTSADYWKQPLKWNRDHNPNLSHPTLKFRRARIFCASLADWLDDEVPIEWFIDLLALIDETPNLDWLLLTKRPENFEPRMRQMQSALDLYGGWIDGEPPSNVWVGTSVEDQKRADERILALLNIPSRIRFLSCEPLLEPLQIREWCEEYGKLNPRIDWVIVGGESGSNARPCNVEWIRDIVRQCKAAGVATFVKQLGKRPYFLSGNSNVSMRANRFRDCDDAIKDRKGGDPSEWPEDLRIREFPRSATAATTEVSP